ncbi:MAG: hypothetical protein ACI4C1_00110 [Lachnospiraceae bacterium]
MRYFHDLTLREWLYLVSGIITIGLCGWILYLGRAAGWQVPVAYGTGSVFAFNHCWILWKSREIRYISRWRYIVEFLMGVLLFCLCMGELNAILQ